MSYLYETHLHTCQGSACGRSTGAEQARFYKEIGYAGIIVTDHTFDAISSVADNLFVIADGCTSPVRSREDLVRHGYLRD